MQAADICPEERTYTITHPYNLVEPYYEDNRVYGKGHSTKHGQHSSNAHTKERKAKRRMNKKHNH